MRIYLETIDYSVSGEKFELQHDENLEMLSTYPIPKNLEQYYESEGYISHTDAKKTWLDKLYHLVKRRNLSKKTQLIENQVFGRLNLLDFGAGTGDFVRKTKERGHKAIGIEPNVKARKLALEKGVKIHTSIYDLNGESFNVITLWHVLEHLPDLEEQIKMIVSKLEPTGILVVAVPNYKSFDAKHYGNYWAGYDVPRHLWHFSRTAIERLFKKHDFRVVSTHPMWFDAFYVSLLSEKYKKSKFPLVKAFLIGFWSNVNAIFNKEYSSLIYILKKDK